MTDQNGRRGFDADARAQARESGPVKIGGKTYHPRRLTNRQLRKVRTYARQAGRDAEEQSRGTEEYKEAFDLALADGKSEAEAREIAKDAGLASDVIADINAESLAHQLHELLVDESMQPVPEEVIRAHLEEDLDSRDVEGLMTYLLGADPQTPETTTASAS